MMNRLKPPHMGRFQAGALDTLSDVGQITVGHTTLSEGNIQTGVTVIRPHPGNLFMHKVPAGAVIINGFGKSVGLMQLAELGVLETPIALTNTFSVPAVSIAQIKQAITQNPECGRSLSTVNPLVMECNDGYLNDIQRMAVTPEHYDQAYTSATRNFEVGSVGAGRGMSCCKLKGGIGTASRIVPLEQAGQQHTYHVGALVLANFGQLARLSIDGEKTGQKIVKHLPELQQEKLPSSVLANLQGGDQGSIIMLIATDAPLDARQLRRLATRASAGLARTGSYYGHGSGDIALAFSTAYTVPQNTENAADAITPAQLLNDAQLENFFEATADSVEQAILSALWHGKTTLGRDGHARAGLLDILKLLPA